MTRFSCRLLEPHEVLPLRSEVLRPGRLPEECVYSNDHKPSTFHCGAVDENGKVVGIVSFHEERFVHEPDAPAMRFQGMAVASQLQGKGVGSVLLKWGLDHARERSAYEIIWCNARTPALGFYRRLGFDAVGDEFITDWGPHYLMLRRL